MALAQKTPILLLDEPTTFLDIGYQLEVMELVEKLNREREMTILLVLHDLNQAARYSDRMIVMRDGALYADGSPHEVLTEALLAEVFKVQATIITDPHSGTPVCLPYRTAQSKLNDEIIAQNGHIDMPQAEAHLVKI